MIQIGESSRKTKKKNHGDADDDSKEENSLTIEDFRGCLYTDHGLPYDDIEELIAKTIRKHGFPHKLHFLFPKWTHLKATSAIKSSVRLGPFNETEKKILSRNFEIIMHSSHVRRFWHTMDDKDDVIVALFGYCSHSQYYPSPYRASDIFSTREEMLRFKFNLGRGLPRRTLMSCYEWVRRTYNPWRDYTEEAFDNAVDHARQVAKTNPDRFCYADVSAKNQVDLRTVQTIYYAKITASGDEPVHNPFTPDEDLWIIEAIMKQSGAGSYKELLRMKQFRAKYSSISRELGTRSITDISARWRRLKEQFTTADELERHAKLAQRYKKDICRMIYCLYRENDEYESQVDWHSLAVGFLTFKMCVHRFQCLKTWIPARILAKRSHQKNVKWLYRNFLPSLTKLTEKKLRKLEAYYLEHFFHNH